jgi:VPDSG-CTERM motif
LICDLDRRNIWSWQGACFIRVTPEANQKLKIPNKKLKIMNKLKYLAAMLIAVAGLGFQQAQAHLVFETQFEANLGNPTEERDYLLSQGLIEECCQFGAKFDDDGGVTGDFAQYFTVSIVGNTATVTWDLPSGFILCGALIKDGNISPPGNDSLFRFYSVSSDELNSGSGTVTFDDPVRDISHITFFVCQEGVPDGGATVMLLGAALGALGMVRRYLNS